MALDESTSALNLRRRYIEGLLFRAVPCLLFVIFFLGAATLNLGLTWGQITPVVWLLGFLVVVNIPFWFIGKAFDFPLSHFYVHWAVDLISYTVKYKQAFEASAALKDYFLEQMSARKNNPTEDIIGDLVTAEIDGEKLSDEAIYSFLRLLLPAHQERTAHQEKARAHASSLLPGNCAVMA
jgi:hypothetical protein